MDFRDCIIDPRKLDDLREVVEDDFAAVRIVENLQPLAAATRLLRTYGFVVGFAWLPSGERVGVLVDPVDLAKALIEVPTDGRLSAVGLAQSIYLTLPKCVLASPNSVDLAIGLLVRAVDQSADIVYDRPALLRRYDRKAIDTLHDVEKLIQSVKSAQTVRDRATGFVLANYTEQRDLEVPETLDVTLWGARVRIREFARGQGVDPASVDPFEKDYVWRLENWHSGNRPDDYHTLDQQKKSLLVSWIKSFFIPASSERSCRRSSYGWKHVLESWCETGIECWTESSGFYVTNGQFKGAMIAAGLLPTRCRELNPFYRIKVRPENMKRLRLAGV